MLSIKRKKQSKVSHFQSGRIVIQGDHADEVFIATGQHQAEWIHYMIKVVVPGRDRLPLHDSPAVIQNRYQTLNRDATLPMAY